MNITKQFLSEASEILDRPDADATERPASPLAPNSIQRRAAPC
jgi:hypothetical protein